MNDGNTMWSIGEDQIEKKELLGSGSFGNVHKVIWTKGDGEKVVAAGKYFRPLADDDIDEIDEIEKEISVLSEINHPNIIKFYGAVKGEKDTILVTEYASGGSLTAHLRKYRESKLPLPEALRLANEAALALEYLHNSNYSHRDVKSKNFVLTGDGTLKLCDFGLSREWSTTYETTKKSGTLVYKSPELLKDGEVSLAVDVYAFGTVFWELLTCQQPYKGCNADKVRSMVVDLKQTPPIPDCCTISLKMLLRSCWNYDRLIRPDMGEVVALIEKEIKHMQLQQKESTNTAAKAKDNDASTSRACAENVTVTQITSKKNGSASPSFPLDATNTRGTSTEAVGSKVTKATNKKYEMKVRIEVLEEQVRVTIDHTARLMQMLTTLKNSLASFFAENDIGTLERIGRGSICLFIHFAKHQQLEKFWQMYENGTLQVAFRRIIIDDQFEDSANLSLKISADREGYVRGIQVFNEDQNTQDFNLLPMEEWSVDLVSEKLRSFKVSEEAIELLHKEAVNGKNLTAYTSEELKEDFPQIKVGPRRAIVRARDHYLKDEKQGEYQKSSSLHQINVSNLQDQEMVSSAVKSSSTSPADASVSAMKSLCFFSTDQHAAAVTKDDTAEGQEVCPTHINKQGARPKSKRKRKGKTTQQKLQVQPSTSDQEEIVGEDQQTTEEPNLTQQETVSTNDKQEAVSEPKKKMLGDKEKQLRRLLLGAEQQHFDQSYYPVLFTNKPDTNYDSEDFEFLTNIGWTAVFDFDPKSNDNGLCYEFCKARKPDLAVPDTLKDTDIELSDTASWIFCNGRSDLEIEEYARSKWHQKRRDYVEDVIKGYEKAIPPERGVVIFLIQSDDNIGVLADSFSKTCSTFHGLENITCIVADDKLYEKWKIEVIGTNCCKADELKARSMIGLQWHDINTFMQRMANVSKMTDLFLPGETSQRSFLLNRRKLDSWHHISVLARNETENIDMTEEHPDFEEFHTGKEINFYRGHKVDWWNFALTGKKYNSGRGYNHVLRRAKCDKLRSIVEEALEGDDYLREVNIYHQAGSGGTTMGRQVLWDLHKQYRCAVVKSVNPNDTRTAEEILELRKYGYQDEENSKPVLILADDLEASVVEKLREDLEYCARNTNIRGVLCVIICCNRTANPESSLANAVDDDERCLGVAVLHQLQKDEQSWFEKKYKELEGRAIEQNTTSPQNLMGFMILKLECSSEYIQGVVSKAVKDLETHFPKEFELVKYTALLNKYDPSGGIPITSCDTLFHGNIGLLTGKYAYRNRTYRGSDFKHWEHQLSNSANLLLIRVETFVPRCSSVMGMKVVGQNVAEAIVSYLLQTKTLAELVMDFLKSEVMSSVVVSRDKHLKPQVHSLLFQRQQSSDKFSPMMEDIIRSEKGMALTIFDVAYDCLNDPFCAQQAARLLYIKDNNYQEAHKKIDQALNDKPNKMSFLWDTKGQIFRKQISEEYTKVYLKDDQPDLILGGDEAKKLIDLTFAAISAFRKSQEESRKEKETNLAGYVGEADVSLQMLEILQRCMQIFRSGNGEVFHNYLLTDKVPSCIPTTWSEFHRKFQLLKSRVDDALNHIAGKDLFFKQYTSKRTALAYEFRKEQKRKLDRQYQRAFGRPPSSKPPKVPNDKAEWNRARVIDMGAGRFHDIFELIRINMRQNVPKLHEALKLTQENNPPNHGDLLRLICITLALSSTGDKEDNLLSVDSLYKYASKMREESFKYDIYGPFFLLMFVWPHPLASAHRIVRDKIRVYISDLQQHYRDNKSKYWRQELITVGSSVKPATFFFLGNGGGLKQFVHIYELSATSKQLEGDRFWEARIVKERLTQLEGNLYNKSTLLYKTPLGDQLEIKLSKPKTRVSQEKVTFYLGFSWSGPIAYNVKYVDSSTDTKLQIFQPHHKALLDRYEQRKELEGLQQKEKELMKLDDIRRGGKPMTYKEKQKLKDLPKIRSKIQKILQSSQS